MKFSENTVNEAGDRTREIISHYRESRKAEEDMIYEIQKNLLSA